MILLCLLAAWALYAVVRQLCRAPRREPFKAEDWRDTNLNRRSSR